MVTTSTGVQAMRSVHKNSPIPPVTITATPSDTVYFDTHPIPDTEDRFMLWDDVLSRFTSALYIQNKTKVLSFMRGSDNKLLEPRRIVAVPDTILDVFVEGPTQSTTSSPKIDRAHANLSQNQDGPRPMDSYRMSANGGEASGQYLMACNYHHGLNGVTQDYAIAAQ
ncbi:hypothetical protein BGZ96_001912 [Linnemannia gamsii]|uniref:Uncharacterized protein n=1 Tax=Linnemannia gamsii TaxID=64522 RepID=A0ABQ7KB62_9FUNG|nr:hypothetical protein BGZ96_001912 [Linnemannia gamsii]